MSNLQLIYQKYLSVLESDYSISNDLGNQFLICKHNKYKSGMYSNITHHVSKVEIHILLLIRNRLFTLYCSTRFEEDKFKDVNQSLKTPINMIKRAEDIVKSIIVFSILTGIVNEMRHTKNQVYVFSISNEVFAATKKLEIDLKTNVVLFGNEKISIDVFTGLLDKFESFNPNDDKISTSDANKIFASTIKNK